MDNKVIWIAGLVALVLVIVFLARRTDDRREEGPPLPVPRPSPEPGVKEERLQCPACQGFGYVMVPRPGGETRKRICQFCGGKGGKILRIPPGHVQCPECQGFGKIEKGDSGSVVCPRCTGRGYIKAPFRPTS